MSHPTSRRSFIQNVGLGSLGAVAAGALLDNAKAQTPAGNTLDPKVYGEQGVATSARPKGAWAPVSDRKVRVGIVGGGFGSSFDFQNHPNVTVAAVSDLNPEKCQRLTQVYQCGKTYPSLEELLKDDSIEAVFIATDAPSHARHCIEALKRGKYVASAVPAVWGSIEDAHKLFETVKACGMKRYMMFETSAFHEDLYAMRQIYQAGGFGKLLYTEGEYYHYMPEPIASYKEWRVGLPPQWYPTHSNAYYVCATGGSFTEVSCMAAPSIIPHLQAANNAYKNPFGSEIALLRTSEGGMARMAVCWDLAGSGGEIGRVRGERGTMIGMAYNGQEKNLPNLSRPALPPNVRPGGHEGSHGPLMHEFITSILEDRKPLVDVVLALNMTVAGIVSHQSALKDGELLKIPQFA
jgi:predicted dehydrogenase